MLAVEKHYNKTFTLFIYFAHAKFWYWKSYQHTNC